MSDAKLIRGQLRQIAKELLPDLLTEQVVESHYKDLRAYLERQLANIEKQVKETLVKIDDRSKEMQLFMMKQVTANQSLPAAVTGQLPPEVQAIIDRAKEGKTEESDEKKQ